MKNHSISTYLLNKPIWVFGVLLFVVSCKNKQENTKPVFDLDTPGGTVVAVFEDNTPSIVDYYKLDESGNQTQEKIGEAKFYIDGQLREGGGLNKGQRNGQWYAFFPDGSVQVDAFYLNGIENGPYSVYRENGTAYYKGHYDNGICDGTWYWYDENGNQTKKIKANKNTTACGYCKKCLELKSKKN